MRTSQPTPNWRDPRTIYLPPCKPTSDIIVRDIVEGRAQR